MDEGDGEDRGVSGDEGEDENVDGSEPSSSGEEGAEVGREDGREEGSLASEGVGGSPVGGGVRVLTSKRMTGLPPLVIGLFREGKEGPPP